LNGNIERTSSVQAFTIGSWDSTTRIGQRATGQFPFNGKIAQVQTYNKQLTQAEILQNYYGGPIVTSGLVFAVDAGNLVSYESGSTSTYSLTGSISSSLINGIGYNNINGGTWNFDGVDDYINSNGISLTTSSFSCESFFQWSTVGGNRGTLHSLSYQYPSSGYLIRQADTNNNRIVVWSDNGTETSVLSTASIPVNTWTHIVVVQNSNNCSIYINGVLDSTQTLNNPVINTAYPYRIGQRGSSGAYLPGKVAVSRIYNRTLTAQEVAQNFNAQRQRFGI
jgi:hypothetical protein